MRAVRGGGPGGHGGMNVFFGGSAGIGRLFGPSMGAEASWLLPAALIGLLAGLWFTRRTARTAPVRAGLLLWGGWLLVTGAVLSFMDGTVHPYYTVALAPAIAAAGRHFGVGAVARQGTPGAADRAGGHGCGHRRVGVRSAGSHAGLVAALRWIVLAGSVVVAAVLAVGAAPAGPCHRRWWPSRRSFRPGRACRVLDLQRRACAQRPRHDVRARP